MLFFQNATVYIAQLTTTKNSEGTKIRTYDFDNPLETFRADIQPNTLTQYQIQLYGIDSKTSNTKKCFYENANYMLPGNVAKVVMDSGSEKLYTIQPVNEWPNHCEALLIPMENL